MSPRPVPVRGTRFLVAAVAVAGVLVSSSRASAESISLYYDRAANPGTGVSVSFNGGNSFSTTPGPYYWHQTGNPMNSNFPANVTTFCVELSQGFPSGSEPFTVEALGAKVSGAKATAITKLWGAHYDTAWEKTGFGGTPQSTAFQLALWELVYDGPGGALNNGNFRYTGASSNASTLAASWLSALASTPASVFSTNFGTSQLVWLSNKHKQDQITMIPGPKVPSVVPAPPSAVLAGFALCSGLVGRALRRRKDVAGAVKS